MPTTDLYAPDFPHGTPKGFDQGCRGAACEYHSDPAWLSCKEAKLRRGSDYALRDHPLDQRIPRDDRPGISPKTTSISDPIPQPAFAEPLATLDRAPVPTPPKAPTMTEQPDTDKPGGVALEKHGTYAGYVAGCRLATACPGITRTGKTCSAARAEYQRGAAARKRAQREALAAAAAASPVEHAAVEELEALAETALEHVVADEPRPAEDPVEPEAEPFPAAAGSTDEQGGGAGREEPASPPAPEPAVEVSTSIAGIRDAVLEAAEQLERDVETAIATPPARSAVTGGDTSEHRTLELTIAYEGEVLATLRVTSNKSTAALHHDMDGLTVSARTW